MTCDLKKTQLMDYLYDEMDGAARQKFETHLAECPECRQELEALEATSQKLRSWEINPPPVNLTFVSETVTWGNRLQQWLTAPTKIWGRRIAFGLAAALLIFSLANFEMSVDNGRFEMKMSLLPRQPAPAVTGISPAELADFKTEQLLLMQQLVTASQSKQRQEWNRTFIDFARELEQQRKTDLKLVGNSFERLQFQTDRQLLQTHQSIDGLMRVMQVQAPGGR